MHISTPNALGCKRGLRNDKVRGCAARARRRRRRRHDDGLAGFEDVLSTASLSTIDFSLTRTCLETSNKQPFLRWCPPASRAASNSHQSRNSSRSALCVHAAAIASLLHSILEREALCTHSSSPRHEQQQPLSESPTAGQPQPTERARAERASLDRCSSFCCRRRRPTSLPFLLPSLHHSPPSAAACASTPSAWTCRRSRLSRWGRAYTCVHCAPIGLKAQAAARSAVPCAQLPRFVLRAWD